jgi:DNA-binding transcriptional LysR family regulator
MGVTCYDSIHMQEPLETAELLAFARTVDARSLSRAAAELGVPRATVSRRLARLEERLAVRLLRRTTRSLKLTDAGEALYRHAQIVLDAVGNAEASVRRTDDVIRGDLRVSLPPNVPPSLRRMLVDFMVRYPDVRLQVNATARRVDLVREGYDVALRAGADLEPGLIARTLATDRTIAAAAPSYLARHGTPKTRKDLAKHRLLMGFDRGELPATHWPFGRANKVHVEGSFFSNDIGLLAEAAFQGHGIAFLPLMMLRPALEDGSLVQVLPGVLENRVRVAVVYPEREFVPPQVRAFVDALVAWAPGELSEELPRQCAAELQKRKAKAA